MNFFKSFLASILGTFVALLFIGIVFFMSLAGLASAVSSEEASVAAIAENSVLELDLDLPVFDNVTATQDFEQALGLGNTTLKFNEVLAGIRKAATDDNIKGIDLKCQFPSMGWSQAQAIRKALSEFRENGKFIYSYADFYSQKGYYLASVSDSIFLNPMGGVEFKGLAAEVLYYKDFQDEYGFKMEVVRHGKYKSAVEPYLENEMSEANRTQISSLLESIWSTVRQEIELSRGLTKASIDEIANQLAASLPKQAVEVGLVDAVLYADQYEEKIKGALDLDSDDRIKKAKFKQLTANNGLYTKGVRDRIAVIYAQGPVMYAEGSENIIGQQVFLDAIEDAVNNRRVKAIVLRIDSPGGSALTSDILWNALEKAKEKKPLVVSMGNVAASGGYYLATAGNEIYANDMTITGSIGVFATVPNVKGFTESIVINAEHVQTHQNALGYSIFETPSGDFRHSIKKGIENVYSTFKSRVAASRAMDMEAVEAIAQGRVWTGRQALDHGLVDGLGGFEAALDAAARLAEIEEYNLISYPKIDPELEDFLSVMSPLSKMKTAILDQFPVEIRTFVNNLPASNSAPQFEARLPFSVEIK